MGKVAAIQEVDPNAAVDNDHPAPRPLRLRAKLPRQRNLPNAESTSCCRRSLIIKRSACSTVCFLVACPDIFWASAINASSISILVRMAGPPADVYRKTLWYTLRFLAMPGAVFAVAPIAGRWAQCDGLTSRGNCKRRESIN